jgi:sugar phosphate permease
MSVPTPANPSRVHYAWVIALVTFVVMLITAGVRAAPGLFMVPLEAEFGWSRAVISASIAVNIALFGLIGPFAASVMNRWGLRRIVLGALALMAGAVAWSTQMSAEWQFFLLWGVVVGASTGVTAMVLAAVVTTRWFEARRGLVMGMLSAANATGQLIFLTPLAKVVESSTWRSAALIVAAGAAIVFVLVWLFMRDRPADVGLRRYGQTADAPLTTPANAMAPLGALRIASRTRAFWILAGTFFICGASTNGLIGTHLISACHDVGIPAVRSAQLLALMGIFDILGTTASGWLTDRYSARHLLFGYYSLRGLSLLFLPATLVDGGSSLGVFAVFYGLDWVATVPPTVKLTTEAFGQENTGVIYGWIGASHQLGASLAAFGAGAIKTELGDYRLAFLIAGLLCLVAGASFMLVGRTLRAHSAEVRPATAAAFSRSSA